MNNVPQLIGIVHGCNGTARVYRDADYDDYVVQFTGSAAGPQQYTVKGEQDAFGRARVLACHDAEDA